MSTYFLHIRNFTIFGQFYREFKNNRSTLYIQYYTHNIVVTFSQHRHFGVVIMTLPLLKQCVQIIYEYRTHTTLS